jgi:hypothetical protein
MKRVGLFLLLSFAVSVRGTTMPQLPSSPSALVTVSPTTIGNLPQLDGAKVQKFHPNAFVLTNQSNKAIVAIMVQWTYVDSTGHPRVSNTYSDSFMQPKYTAYLPARARLLVAPGAFLPESLAQSAHIGAQLDDLDGRRERDIASASEIAAHIDLIIFEDGELVGPNQTRYEVMIQDRKLAATQIAMQLRNTLANGDDPKVTIGHILESVPAQSDYVGTWTHTYAKMIRRAPSVEKQLEALETLPEPPKFYRRKP